MNCWKRNWSAYSNNDQQKRLGGNVRKLFFVLLLFIVVTGTAYADRGDQFLIPKVGFMSVDLNSADPLYSLGVMYGYGYTPEITFEGEINIGVAGGESDLGDYKIWTVAGYGVYRYPITDVDYIKAKLGLLHENIEVAGFSADDQAIAGGFGYGFKYNTTIFELEATIIDADIIFYSLGINYPF